MSVGFRFDWVDAGPSPDALARDTMAALTIEAGDATVTSVLDRRNGLYRRHVVTPLFSVAEWLVCNWWHIWYEVEDAGAQRIDFESRHNLAFAGDGFVLPSLTMVPMSGRMQLRWTKRRPRHAGIEFVDGGEELVEHDALETELRGLIDAVLERLRNVPGHDSFTNTLDETWAAINALDADEREFSRAAALLGLDPFDVQDSLAEAIATFWEGTDPAIRADALAGADASDDSLRSIGEWLGGAREALAAAGNGKDWAPVRHALPAPMNAAPWTKGYALAREVRRQLGAGDGRFDFGAGGVPAADHHDAPPPSARIHGLVAADSPACVTAARRESGTRFLRARALGDYLGRSRPGLGLLSSLATDRQQQSRAFAAELLAPAASLRARLAGEFVEVERVDDLCGEFGVSSEVIRRQIENHGLGRIVAY